MAEETVPEAALCFGFERLGDRTYEARVYQYRVTFIAPRSTARSGTWIVQGPSPTFHQGEAANEGQAWLAAVEWILARGELTPAERQKLQDEVLMARVAGELDSPT